MTNAHSEDPLWFVQFSSDEVRCLGLDDLDQAFQAGTIDESTLVREDGSSAWMTLGAMLAGDASVPEAAPISVPPPSAAPPPVVAELDLAGDMPSFGASRKRAAIFGVVAVLGVVGAVAVTAGRMSGSSLPDTSKVTASLGGAAGPLAQQAQPELAPDAGTRFNEDQRRLLLEADKKRDAESNARRAAAGRSGSNAPSRPIKIGDPITKGGSKYDPLNGQL